MSRRKRKLPEARGFAPSSVPDSRRKQSKITPPPEPAPEPVVAPEHNAQISDLEPFSNECTTLIDAASPLFLDAHQGFNPPMLEDFDSSSPQVWGVRGATTAVEPATPQPAPVSEPEATTPELVLEELVSEMGDRDTSEPLGTAPEPEIEASKTEVVVEEAIVEIVETDASDRDTISNLELQAETQAPDVEVVEAAEVSDSPDLPLPEVPVTGDLWATPVEPLDSDLGVEAETTELAIAPEATSKLEDPEISNSTSEITPAPEALKTPAAIALVAFALFWALLQAYADWVQETLPSGSLSGRKLARRLGVSPSTIHRHKIKPDFSTWTQSLDPEGVAWVYQQGIFVPKGPV